MAGDPVAQRPAGPVRSGAGFHVLKLIEKSRASLPATVVQSRARHILLRTSAQLSETAAVDAAGAPRNIMAQAYRSIAQTRRGLANRVMADSFRFDA